MLHMLKTKGLGILGVTSILLGAVMVFASGAGASTEPTDPSGVYGGHGDNVNLKCEDLDDGTEHGEPSLDFGVQSDVEGASYTTRVVDGAPLHIDWTSPSPVGFVLVKQSTYSAVFVVNGATSGTVYVALGDDATASDQGLSHVSFCTGPLADITIKKLLAGDDVPEDWAFEFTSTVDGRESFTLSDEFPTKSFHLQPGEYTFTELETDGSELTGIDCGAATTVDVDGGVTVTLEDGDAFFCTFTNTFPTKPRADITIKKLLAGDVVPEDWAFEFTSTVDDLESFTLSDEFPTKSFHLDPGDYTFTELETDGSELTGIDCGAATTVDVDGGVTVTLEDGDAFFCTFTNTYPTPPADPVLSIEKVIDGDAPDEWSFDFTGDLGSFTLSDDAPAKTDSVAPGVYTIVETDTDETDLDGVDCGDASAVDADGGVTVTLEAGDEVSCTFTNSFVPEETPDEDSDDNEVLDEVIVKAKTPNQPVASPEVLDSTTGRTLARTGSASHHLAGVGAALFVLGLILVAGQRRTTLARL